MTKTWVRHVSKQPYTCDEQRDTVQSKEVKELLGCWVILLYGYQSCQEW